MRDRNLGHRIDSHVQPAGRQGAYKGAEVAQAIDQGRKIGAKSQRERDYLEAVAAYYADFPNRSERSRQESRSKAYEALAQRYPQDDEAQIFNALYLAGTQTQADQTYAAYLKAAKILETQFAKYPNHPGVAHYLSTVTTPRRSRSRAWTPPRGVMPGSRRTRRTHCTCPRTFSRGSAHGRNRSRPTGDRPRLPSPATKPMRPITRRLCGVCAAAARARRRGAPRTGGGAQGARLFRALRRFLRYGGDGSALCGRARQLARRDGAERAAVEVSVRRCDHALLAWAGAARSNDVAAAQKEAEALAALHKALQDAKNSYWANEVEVQRPATAGWIALAQKNNDDALKFMRAAADLEDRNEKHIVTPGRVLPARELLGDMLMQMGQPAQALKEYEARRSANRIAFAGCTARRLRRRGRRSREGVAHFARLAEMTKGADTSRPEMTRVKAALASR